jgi:hypothetical protein
VGEFTLAKKLPKRSLYTIKQLMTDLKSIDATPSVLYDVGSELIYRELDWCRKTLGDDHLVTKNLMTLMDFMQSGYEHQLVIGELCGVKDTPKSAINAVMREMPNEFLGHPIGILSDQIELILKKADESRREEKKRYKGLEKRIRAEIKADKKNPDLWNQLRVLLWIVGKYTEASEAFKTAKELGWTAERSNLVAL